jgi:hypothetical protein
VFKGCRYIAKFASVSDEHDMDVVEAATLSMARACGIAVPAFDLRSLAGGHALLVAQLGSHTGYQELPILPGQHVASLALVREAALHFGLSESRAAQIIQSIGQAVAALVRLAVASAGGSPALASRMTAYVAQQADRIAA